MQAEPGKCPDINRELFVFNERLIEQARIAAAEHVQANIKRERKIAITPQAGSIVIAIPDWLADLGVAMRNELCFIILIIRAPLARATDQPGRLDLTVILLSEDTILLGRHIPCYNQDRIFRGIMLTIK